MPYSRAPILCLVLVMHISAPLPAAFPDWTLEIDDISMGDATVRDIRIASVASNGQGEEGRVELNAAVILPGEGADAYGPFSLSCPGDLSAVATSYCQEGAWVLEFDPGWPNLEGTLEQTAINDDGISLRTRGKTGALVWTVSLETVGDAFSAALQVPEQPVAALSFLEGSVTPIAWVSAGTLSGSATWSTGPVAPAEARARAELSGLEFDSPDGLYAGLGVNARISILLEPGEDVGFAVDGRLGAGELLLGDFYRDFSDHGIDLSAKVVFDEALVDAQRITFGDGEALHVAGEARVPLGTKAGAPELALRELRLEFPEAYSRYLESLASVYDLDGLETSGTVSWAGDWLPGTARSGELHIDGFSANDAKRGRFTIENVDGTLRTGSESRLTWDATSFVKLDLGAGEARIALEQESLRLLQPLRIDVFGGNLSLDELSIGFPREGEPDIQLQASLDDIEMQQMSSALGWPEFAGTLSGTIPGINWSGGVIAFEGALDFEVFGGEIVLTDLRVERPFGVLPSLAANITATALDLQQVTQTFEFGRIAGQVDGYVRDLRMLDWQPVQFDAWFGTPEGSGRNDISRQAVRHLATIGGGSPTAMLSGPVLRLFNNFSYRRLGLGCVLQDNVCRIRGIEQQGDAVLLLEGAGIPKISILAYNRVVDWPQLVTQLVAVTEGEDVRIGD